MFWILRILSRPGEIQVMKKNGRLLDDLGSALEKSVCYFRTAELSFRWLSGYLDRVLENPTNISETASLEYESYFKHVNNTLSLHPS
jgi:hypothetical protein